MVYRFLFRTMRKPVASPQPSPRPSISQQHSSNEVSPATSCHNLQLLSPRRKLSGDSVEVNLARSSGVVNSALRKKKPAPPPPPTLVQKASKNEVGMCGLDWAATTTTKFEQNLRRTCRIRGIANSNDLFLRCCRT